MDTAEEKVRAQRIYVQTLQNLVKRRHEIDMQIRLVVIAAQQVGVSWRDIGGCLGTSGQAAWQKYRPREAPEINGYTRRIRIEKRD